MGCKNVFEWHKSFAEERETLEDTGWLRMAKTELSIQEVAMLVQVNCSQMVDEEAPAAAGFSHCMCHKRGHVVA
jgi:hypothetical protein